MRSGRLRVCPDGQAAVHDSDVSLICVGTPSNGNGSLNLRYVENVCREIGSALATKPGYHVVVVRSTVLPGTVQERLIPLLEDLSGKRAISAMQSPCRIVSSGSSRFAVLAGRNAAGCSAMRAMRFI